MIDKISVISAEQFQKFAEGARSASKRTEFQTPEEWGILGLRQFKRRTLGFCGAESTKTLEVLAGVLSELHVTSSEDEGKEFIRGLYGREARLGSPWNYLTFERAINPPGVEACRITAHVIQGTSEEYCSS